MPNKACDSANQKANPVLKSLLTKDQLSSREYSRKVSQNVILTKNSAASKQNSAYGNNTDQNATIAVFHGIDSGHVRPK